MNDIGTLSHKPEARSSEPQKGFRVSRASRVYRANRAYRVYRVLGFRAWGFIEFRVSALGFRLCFLNACSCRLQVEQPYSHVSSACLPCAGVV